MNEVASTETPAAAAPKQRLLPRLIPIDTPRYYVFLGAIAIFILGPLGGITASYMNFSLGFFVGGQVLAGILGSTVTYFYGPDGKHGANYMQTMAASVASMAAMGVLIQAMIWLGLPEPAAWKLVLYFLCVGMFGVGVGMLYTPILVDKLKLTYPSGMAVAAILRALTDVKLLKRSVTQLFTGIGIGLAFPLLMEKLPGWLGDPAKAGTLAAGSAVLASVVAAVGVGGGERAVDLDGRRGDDRLGAHHRLGDRLRRDLAHAEAMAGDAGLARRERPLPQVRLHLRARHHHGGGGGRHHVDPRSGGAEAPRRGARRTCGTAARSGRRPTCAAW